jgi:S-DNA-T family DNA segregation ATPase FtsK/SpoIIIE
VSSRPARLVAPADPAETPPPRFPWVATLAPVIVAVILWLVTGSAFALIFAALGPVTAIASVVDARLGARRTRRRETARLVTERDALGRALDAIHDDERHSRRLEVPGAPAIVGGAVASRRDRIALGLGPVPLDLAIDGADRSRDSEVVALGERAGVLAAGPVEALADRGIGIVAPPTLARALERSLAVQLAAQETSENLSAPIAIASTLPEIPAGVEVVVGSAAGETRVVRHPDRHARGVPLTLQLVSELDAARWARSRRSEDDRALPDRLPLAPLLTTGDDQGDHRRDDDGLACRPAVDADGPVVIDLVADGPHAIVGGTTGSGKSELLIAWMLALASAHPPERVVLLLIDFKGGATFAPVEALPHTVGLITDLDHGGAQRALASLAAELRYRERTLAAQGLRDIVGSSLPRLVIVVDEFAAMLDQHPELPGLFADLAARGRSLGIHLVLATQRPAGVVRDSLLANADLRISLRVNNAADSMAVVGTAAAAEIPATQRGRAFVRTASAAARPVQFALADAADIARVAASRPASPVPRRPWCPPLPTEVSLSSLAPADSAGDDGPGIPFGLLDEPDEQRQSTAHWDALTGLLVIGAARSGLTTTLTTLAQSAATGSLPVEWMPASPDAAWDLLDDLLSTLTLAVSHRRVLLIDDLDAVIARFDGEHRAAFSDGLARILREGPGRGLVTVAAVQRMTGEAATLAGALPQRLLLRQASRQDHVLAGGEGRDFDGTRPPGSGWWRGCRVHVARSAHDRPRDPDARVAPLTPGRPLAVVSSRPGTLAERLVGRVLMLDELAEVPQLTEGDILLGDIDAWQSRWGLLAAVRDRADVIVESGTPADVRVLTRSRRMPPPLAAQFGLAWRLVAGGGIDRVMLPVATAHTGADSDGHGAAFADPVQARASASGE